MRVRTAAVESGLLFSISLGTLRATEITFSKDVAPILYHRCVSCHQPDDIAPMSLVRYSEARPWAKAIRQAVVTRRMPPWHADPRYGRFENDPSLSQAEIDTIRAWVDQGAQEGDPKDVPSAPLLTEGWRIGKPDAIISMPTVYTITPGGPDDYQSFRDIPTNFKEDVWIKAIELRPGNRRVVHHAHVFLTRPKSAENRAAAGSLLERYTYKDQTLLRMRPEAPVIDDSCREIGEGGLPDRKFHEETQILTTYVPGRAPEVYPDGYARLIPAGSTIGFQIHYAKSTGKQEEDRTSVGLIFAQGPPKKVLRRLDMDAFLFRIPPGAANHEVTFCYEFKQDSRLLALTPHMHLRGKDMKWELLRPDAVKETVLFVPRYDFNWQIEYKLKEPVSAPKGSRLIITAHFDNSANNPANPDPAKTVRWGASTSDEMAASWVAFELTEELPSQTQQASSDGSNRR
ncbi:MAG: cytochrome c [Acidobacteria bacterium]|nr:cytochrome c [Acidobacteriota bacterium]